MVERNVDTPEARRIVYRIGVHLGDVLIDGDDILGEGVNIAARLESICEPGGVSISRAVYDQISGKLALGFRTLGLQKLKNVAKAVEVLDARWPPASLAPASSPCPVETICSWSTSQFLIDFSKRSAFS
jgi:adenylate cyclase